MVPRVKSDALNDGLTVDPIAFTSRAVSSRVAGRERSRQRAARRTVARSSEVGAEYDEHSAIWLRHDGGTEEQPVEPVVRVRVAVAHDLVAREHAHERARDDIARPVLIQPDARES